MSSTPVVISAASKHTATIIFLHGLGDTGHGWASAIGSYDSLYEGHLSNCSYNSVTLNNGFQMPSWFDLRSLDAAANEDEVGIKKAAEGVHAMIEAEEKSEIYFWVLGGSLARCASSVHLHCLYPFKQSFDWGFSQGGALALYSAFTYPKKLAGVMVLSCWLPLHKQFPSAAVGNLDIPIVQCHGDCDPLVPYKWGQLTASVIKQFAKNLEFRTYKGLSHSSSEEEMKDLKAFVDKVLPLQ